LSVRIKNLVLYKLCPGSSVGRAAENFAESRKQQVASSKLIENLARGLFIF